MEQIKQRTIKHIRKLGLLFCMTFSCWALCHAEAAETTVLGIKYTKVGDGMCRASMVEGYVRSSYEVKSPVTIDGEECRVTSISDMGINAVWNKRIDDYSAYEVYLAKYKIKFPEFVDTICEFCFHGPGREKSYYKTGWLEFNFPKARVIESYAFATCLPDIVIPEGVEEIGYLINGHEESNPTILSLPSTLKRMSALALSREELTPSVTIWASTPPEIIPLANVCDLPITDPYGLSADSLEYKSPYVTIYVPEGSVEAYKSAPGWCKVPNILPIKSGRIDGVASDSDEVRFEVSDGSVTAVNGEAPVEVYATDGCRVAVGADGTVSGLDAGLYIVRCGATATKLIVR